MAEHSINHLTQLINQQIDSQELINEKLIKAKSLLDMILERDLLIQPFHLLHHYLWVVSDLVEIAANTIEASLNDLLRAQKLNFSYEEK